jgi:hypothetical protein
MRIRQRLTSVRGFALKPPANAETAHTIKKVVDEQVEGQLSSFQAELDELERKISGGGNAGSEHYHVYVPVSHP